MWRWLRYRLARDPQTAAGWVQRGWDAFEADRTADAVAAFDRAVALAPDDAFIQRERGDALRLVGHLPAALAAYDRALQLAPADWKAWAARGEALIQLGRFADARAACTTSLQLQPRGNEFASRHRAVARLGLGEWAEALADCDTAEAAGIPGVAVAAIRCQAYAELGRKPEAWVALADALAGRVLPWPIETIEAKLVALVVTAADRSRFQAWIEAYEDDAEDWDCPTDPGLRPPADRRDGARRAPARR